MRTGWNPEDLIDCWTLVEDNWRLVGNATYHSFEGEVRRPLSRTATYRLSGDCLAIGSGTRKLAGTGSV